MASTSLLILLSVLYSASLLAVAQGQGEGRVPWRRAWRWLSERRQADGGWATDTPRALLALQLANASAAAPLETALAAKQMELELVLQLWRHHESPISPGRLAQYTLAMNALCKDPRQFHNHDLISMLQHHEAELDYDFAFTAMAICSSGAHVRKRQIRRLLDIADKTNENDVESLAMVLLALKCIVKDHRNRNLLHYLRKPMISLAERQQDDGSFGGVQGTALTFQALDGYSQAEWNRTSAISWLVSQQNEDGSFSDVATTADVSIALGKRNLNSIRDIECSAPSQVKKVSTTAIPSLTVLPESESSLSQAETHPKASAGLDMVTVSYTVWVGSNITESYTLNVKVDRNASFYQVMMVAAEQNTHFQFEATEWPNGHYVHTLSGRKEEPSNYYFWLLYQTPNLPDQNNPPGNQLITPVGVDGLTVEDGDHYLFWYKKL